MGIEVAKFPQGLLANTFDETLSKPLNAIRRREVDVELLQEGEYDVTPSHWTHHLFTYNLLVKEDGTGTFRQIPRSLNAGVLQFSTDTDNIILRRGGHIYQIPQEATDIPLATPNLRRQGESTVYAFIRHVPGRSPQTTKITPKR